MENLQERIKPFLQPLIHRIEALEAQNKIIKQLCQNTKNAQKHHIKPHEVKNVHHPIKTPVVHNKEKQKENKIKVEGKTVNETKKIEEKNINSQVHLKVPSTSQKVEISKEKPKSSHKQVKDKQVKVKPSPSPAVDKQKKSVKTEATKQDKKENIASNNVNINAVEDKNQHHLVKSKQRTNLIKEKHLNIDHKKLANSPQLNKDIKKDAKDVNRDRKYSDQMSDIKNKNKVVKNQKQQHLIKSNLKNEASNNLSSKEHKQKMPNPEHHVENVGNQKQIQQNQPANEMAEFRQLVP